MSMEEGTDQKAEPRPVTEDTLDEWATDRDGPVALHREQRLIPVEGEGGVIFPPTYADIGYNIDELSDGTKVATIDSVGSQANRMEPLFKEEPFSQLVPQIKIELKDGESISILEVGHRLGDALIRSTDLGHEAKEAFQAWIKGDASKLAELAPTSIVFGAWDSRDTGAKLPRIVQSVIRAWDVDELKRAAQYEPPVDYAELGVVPEEEQEKAEEGNPKEKFADRGFVHVPSGEVEGGVVAQGPIRRDTTVNLIALRRLPSLDGGDGTSDSLQKYIFGLSLVSATAPFEGFLRQGCLLTPDPSTDDPWMAVMRDGTRQPVDLNHKQALQYALSASEGFGVGEDRVVTFDKDKAEEDLKA